MLKNINKTHIKIFFIIFIILFIILLGFYPGIIPYDGNNQWQQVQSGIITDAHPFFSTFFMLILSKIWNSATIVIIYQIVLFAIAWSYLCKKIVVKDKKQVILVYIVSIVITLIPLTCFYEITLWKDIIYTSYLFLCAIMLYDWGNNNYSFSIKKYSVFGLMLAMVFSYRHNGIIVAILLLFIFYMLCIRKYRKKIIDKCNLKKCFSVLISFVIILTIISIPKKIILDDSSKKLKNDPTYSESYSTIDGYMLWMMGAHLNDNNIKNKSDIEFLNKIIPINDWKEAYNPYLINTTHEISSMNRDFIKKNNKKFENIFIKYSKKYPLTILKHYTKSDALLFNPISSIKGYVYVFPFPEMWALPKYTVFRPIIPGIKWFFMKLSDFTFIKPFIIFYEPAFILYLSLIITIILSKKVYGKKIWLFILPMILNIVSLTPINLAQDLRYVYINYLTFYGLVLMIIINYKKIFSKTKKEKLKH